MFHATFATPDLTTFCGLDELGLEVVGQRLEPDRTVLECRLAAADAWCRGCGAEGVPRGTVTRRLAHEPFGHRPTTLLLRVRRYRCSLCGRTWRQDTTAAAPTRAKLSRGGLRRAPEGIVIDHLSMARVAAGLGVAWHGDNYVTVIMDRTPIREKTGPSRLLDMDPGRSEQAFKTWLSARPKAWRDALTVVAMDGFAGFKTAAAEEVPDAVAIMDPFHVVRLAGDALDDCRRRVQQHIHGHRGRKGDPLYGARRTLHTGMCFLTERQGARLDALFADERHGAVEVTWEFYQRLVTAYREPDRAEGKQLMQALIDAIGSRVPQALKEIGKLGRTLKR